MVVVEAAAVAAGPTRLQRWPGSVACGPQQSKVGCCWWSAGVVVGAAGWQQQFSASVVAQPQQREVGAVDVGHGGRGPQPRDQD